MHIPTRPLHRQLALALVSVLMAWSANILLWPIIQPSRFPFYFIAVTIASWGGGQFAGLAATLLSSLATTYFFLEPEFSARVSLGGVLSIGIFTCACALIIVLTDRLRLAEYTARRTAERLNAVVESIDEPLSVLDSEWRFRDLNAACERYLRLDRSELLGKVVWELFPATQGTLFEDYYRRAVRDRVTVRFEAFHRANDRWLIVRAVPFQDGLVVSFREFDNENPSQNVLAETARGSWRATLLDPPPVGAAEEELVDAIFKRTALFHGHAALGVDVSSDRPPSIGDVFPMGEPTNLDTARAFVRSGFRLDNAVLIRGGADGTRDSLLHQLVGRIEGGELRGVTGIVRQDTTSERRPSAIDSSRGGRPA